MRPFPLLGVALLLTATALLAPAQATQLPGGPPLRVLVEDSDGDGHQEATFLAQAGGPCGCACPVVGGFVVATAAGQRVVLGAATIVVVCGTAAWGVADPGNVDPTAPASVTFTPILWPPLREIDATLP